MGGGDPRSVVHRVTKRGVDLVIGLALTLATLPVVLVAMLVSAITLRAWPLFVQTRVGEGGEALRIPKVRTLPPDFPTYALKPAVASTAGIPRPMAFLRERKLDELPQLWLVVAGRLSLVGPRPKMPDGYEPVDRDYRRVRLQVPQGCTCLWQISDQAHLLPSQAPEFDITYVREGTLRLDLWILWRTALRILGPGRPISLDQVPAWTRRGSSPATTRDRAARPRTGHETASPVLLLAEAVPPDASRR